MEGRNEVEEILTACIVIAEYIWQLLCGAHAGYDGVYGQASHIGTLVKNKVQHK